MDLGELEWEGVDLIHLAQDREQWRVLMNTVMILRVPYPSIHTYIHTFARTHVHMYNCPLIFSCLSFTKLL